MGVKEKSLPDFSDLITLVDADNKNKKYSYLFYIVFLFSGIEFLFFKIVPDEWLFYALMLAMLSSLYGAIRRMRNFNFYLEIASKELGDLPISRSYCYSHFGSKLNKFKMFAILIQFPIYIFYFNCTVNFSEIAAITTLTYAIMIVYFKPVNYMFYRHINTYVAVSCECEYSKAL